MKITNQLIERVALRMWRADGEPDDQVRRDAGLYDVPCNGCTLCCHNDAVRILPHEDASKWQTEPHDYLPGAQMLAHKPNGDCVYLDEHGCTIQHDKPQQCREMDCRLIARRISWTQARKMDADGRLRMSIWRRGRDLAKDAEAR